MSNENKRFEKLLDVLLDEATEASLDKELDGYESAEKHVFSKEHEEKMKKLFRKQKRKLFFKQARKIASRAACFLLAIALTSGVVVFSVSAWRIKFLNFMLDLSKPNSDFSYTENISNSYKDDDIEFQYLPDGFGLEKKSILDDKIRLSFSRGEDYIALSCSHTEGDFSADTENAQTQDIVIMDSSAIYIEKDQQNIAIWYKDNIYYSIVSNLDKNEIIAIGDGIIK